MTVMYNGRWLAKPLFEERTRDLLARLGPATFTKAEPNPFKESP